MEVVLEAAKEYLDLRVYEDNRELYLAFIRDQINLHGYDTEKTRKHVGRSFTKKPDLNLLIDKLLLFSILLGFTPIKTSRSCEKKLLGTEDLHLLSTKELGVGNYVGNRTDEKLYKLFWRLRVFSNGQGWIEAIDELGQFGTVVDYFGREISYHDDVRQTPYIDYNPKADRSIDDILCGCEFIAEKETVRYRNLLKVLVSRHPHYATEGAVKQPFDKLLVDKLLLFSYIMGHTPINVNHAGEQHRIGYEYGIAKPILERSDDLLLLQYKQIGCSWAYRENRTDLQLFHLYQRQPVRKRLVSFRDCYESFEQIFDEIGGFKDVVEFFGKRISFARDVCLRKYSQGTSQVTSS